MKTSFPGAYLNLSAVNNCGVELGQGLTSIPHNKWKWVLGVGWNSAFLKRWQSVARFIWRHSSATLQQTIMWKGKKKPQWLRFLWTPGYGKINLQRNQQECGRRNNCIYWQWLIATDTNLSSKDVLSLLIATPEININFGVYHIISTSRSDNGIKTQFCYSFKFCRETKNSTFPGKPVWFYFADCISGQ